MSHGIQVAARLTCFLPTQCLREVGVYYQIEERTRDTFHVTKHAIL
jgi:hypothetical protein